MKKEVKKGKKKKTIKIKDPKRLILAIAVVLIIIILVFYKINEPKKPERLSLLLNNQEIIQDLKSQVCVIEDVIYFSLDDVKQCLDNDLYLEDNKIILSSPKKIAAIELENSNMEINGSTVLLKGQAFKNDDGIIYLPLSELQNVYDMQLSYSEYYKNITIDFNSKRLEKAYTTKKVSLKEEKNTFSSTLEIIPSDEWVIYLSEEDGWAKIRSQNGNIGYIKKRKLKDFTVEREDFIFEEKNIQNVDFSQDISKKNISKYENRKNVIDEILVNTVSKGQKEVKIIYNKDKNLEEYKRFKTEATAILSECGITAVFK